MVAHRFWVAGGLVLAVLFLAWSVWLIVASNALQGEVSHRANVVRQLMQLEDSVRNLERALPRRQEEFTGDRWQPLNAGYRKQAAQIDDPTRGEIHDFLTRADAAVARMEQHHARLKQSRAADEAVEAFRAEQGQALDAIKEAVRALRGRLTGLSVELSGKWRYLNGLALLSGVLAVGAVVLLGFYQSDLGRRKHAEAQARRLSDQLQQRVVELQDALVRVTQLQGLLPICAWCKKIRDDQDYWHEVEAYVGAHSEARFTHGMCPCCLEKQLAALRQPEPPVPHRA